MPIGRLHVLTDFVFQQRIGHADLAAEVIRGGADTIQFRQKDGGIRHQLIAAQQTAAVCRAAGVPMVVDDDVALALAVEAVGVHLGQTDLPVDVARRILGPDAVVGATTATLEQAVRAEALGASYLGFGPVFPTRSKRNPLPARGLDVLRSVCDAVSIPVIAIAGITPERTREALGAGAHGVAVMTAITTAPSPEQAAAEIRRVIDEVLGA